MPPTPDVAAPAVAEAPAQAPAEVAPVAPFPDLTPAPAAEAPVVPEPETPAVTEPAPTPETAVDTPAPAAEEPAAPAPSAQPSQAQTTSDEEETIKAQIESFVSQNSQTAPGAEPTTPAPAPSEQADTAEKPAEEAAPSSTDTMMADAIKGLTGDDTPAPADKDGNTTMPAPNVVTPGGGATPETPAPTAPAEEEEDDNSPTHKKIIKPLGEPVGPQQPDLNELLAKEGIANFDDEPHPLAPNPQQPHAGLPTTPHPPGHVISPNQGGGVDPNSIAL